MYGTTIRSFNESKEAKTKKTSGQRVVYRANSKKDTKKSKKAIDTQYVNMDRVNSHNNVEQTEKQESFSIKDLPIASVIVTLLLTMMILVMTSGFGGL